MSSAFDHEDLRVYQAAIEFVAWLEGVALNIAEGNGKFSTKDRCRFIGHARTAALQAAATLDVHAIRQAKDKQDGAEGKKLLADIVRMLVAWERSLQEE